MAKNKWITWNGGECPVPGETMVEVRYPNPKGRGSGCASEFAWSHYGRSADIIAYRVVDPAPMVTAAPCKMKLSELEQAIRLAGDLSTLRRLKGTGMTATVLAAVVAEISRITAELTALGIEVDE